MYDMKLGLTDFKANQLQYFGLLLNAAGSAEKAIP
jgi:hypothetical protein